MSRYNYFGTILIDGYAFPEIPQAVFDFNSQGFKFLNRGAYPIEYSFDGTHLHGDLNPADASKEMSFDGRCECKVFFRAKDGYGICRVEAWR